jgi:putative tributyrin esterase
MALIDFKFQSNVLEMNCNVQIILPNDVKKDEKLKVLYLLHGYIGDYADWMRFSSIERYSWDYRYAIVMPGGHNSYYTDTKYQMNYYTYLSKELPSFMTNFFPISDRREDNFICGLSMGGYGALKVGLSNPDRYSKVISLSGVTDIVSVLESENMQSRNNKFVAIFGNDSIKDTKHDLFYLVNQIVINKQEMPSLYIACGKEDFLYEDNLRFKKHLEMLNVKHTFIESKGEHNWEFWDEYIKKVLAWL